MEPVTVVYEQGTSKFTVTVLDLHTVGFEVIHDVTLIYLSPSSPDTVFAAIEIYILPSLRTAAVSFEKLGIVVKVLVKAQPAGIVTNRNT